MSRPKGSKNKETLTEGIEKKNSGYGITDIPTPPPPPPIKKRMEPESEYISIFEAANRLDTSEATIKTWIDHGHLTARNGRVSVGSITRCKFNTRRPV